MRIQFRTLNLLAVFTAAFFLTLANAVAGEAEEGTARSLYTEALMVERSLRQPGTLPPVGEIRAVIAGYERVILEYSRSPFADHALWHASGLAAKAFEHYGYPQDHETALRLLAALSENYPVSQFTDRVPGRLNHLAEYRQTASLNAITHEVLKNVDRITISLNKSVLFRSEYLDEPDRWFVDLINTTLSPSMEHTDTIIQPNAIAVSSLRIGRHPDHTTRVAVDLKQRDACHSYTLYDPFRVILDCVETDQLKQIDPLESDGLSFVESLNHFEPDIQISSTLVDKLSPSLHRNPDLLREDDPLLTTRARAVPEPNLDGSYSIARQLGLQISRIVIDAGHGGHDPGAVGGGMTEADLVLDLALRLEDRFLTTRPDLEIVQTRRTDRYLPLEARTTLANRVAADLFLSIHVNASENKAARGIETYYLDFTSDNNSADLTVHENIDGLNRMNQVDNLVSSIALQTKLDESKEFANTIQHAMVRKLRAVDPELPNLGVKRAPFVVLIGANMPSVLAEVSFLSNEHDATMLSTDAYRDLIVDALFTSILRYERSLAPATLVAQGEAARLQ